MVIGILISGIVVVGIFIISLCKVASKSDNWEEEYVEDKNKKD